MSYKPQSKLYDLEFQDFPGLEVRTRSASIGEIQKSYQLNVKIDETDPEKQSAIFTFFESKLVSWNLVHPELSGVDENGKCALCGLAEDDPMPPTKLGMMCLDLGLIMSIITGWITTVARVTPPKGQSSNSGGIDIPEEVMRQLEMLQSPTKLPTPNLS
jgi:hypothetical protein